ncbi:MAG: sulfotransferase [Candidatus Neomarinimicrobiota bacterium]
MIFVVGVGRSGTTLLQAMLNAHSRVAFIPEINFVRRFLATNKLEKTMKKKGRDGLLQLLYRDRWIRRLDLDLTQVLPDFEDKKEGISLRTYQSLVDAYRKRTKKEKIGDKDPRSVEYLPLLKTHFPNATVIHIVRDPRDVLVSKFKAAWSKNKSIFRHVLVNKFQLWMAHKHADVFGDRFLEVNYEELVSKPEEVLERICLSLGIEFEESMLMYHESAENLVTDEELQWKREILGPLKPANVGKWKKELTNWQVALVEENVDLAFRHYGYSRSYPAISGIQSLSLKFTTMTVSVLVKTLYTGKCYLRKLY